MQPSCDWTKIKMTFKKEGQIHFAFICGEGGIRTRDTFWVYTLSKRARSATLTSLLNEVQKYNNFRSVYL